MVRENLGPLRTGGAPAGGRRRRADRQDGQGAGGWGRAKDGVARGVARKDARAPIPGTVDSAPDH